MGCPGILLFRIFLYGEALNSNHPDILKYWPLIRDHGVGLPQEYFIETTH